jgi:hypothetical protein
VSDESRALVRLGDRGLVATDLDGLWRMAVLIAKSGMAPKGMERPETLTVAMAMGAEVGLSPMQSIQQISVINGRPVMWGDAPLALVRASGLLVLHEEGIEGNLNSDAAYGWCRVQRRGDPKPSEMRFSVSDAKRAGLWGKSGPWANYPQRQIVLRPRSWILRDRFGDLLRGIRSAEEVLDEPPQIVVSATPSTDSLALPLEPIRRADPRERDRIRQEVAAVVEPPRPAEAASDTDDAADYWDEVEAQRSGPPVTPFDVHGLPV